jgi:hypothetical protein
MRIELTTSSLPRKCSTAELQQLGVLGLMERAPRCTKINPRLKKSGRPGSNRLPSAWKADALPNELLPLLIFPKINKEHKPSLKLNPFPTKKMWGEKDSNLRTRKRTDLQSVAVGHLAISPTIPYWYGAEEGTRTPDQLITNQLLYQLSYFGLIFSKL